MTTRSFVYPRSCSWMEEVALVFDLRYFSKKADRYRSVDAAAGPDAGLLELETKQRLLGIGGGLVFSTVKSGSGPAAGGPVLLSAGGVGKRRCDPQDVEHRDRPPLLSRRLVSRLPRATPWRGPARSRIWDRHPASARSPAPGRHL